MHTTIRIVFVGYILYMYVYIDEKKELTYTEKWTKLLT
jgi:hypothetical protein